MERKFTFKRYNLYAYSVYAWEGSCGTAVGLFAKDLEGRWNYFQGQTKSRIMVDPFSEEYQAMKRYFLLWEEQEEITKQRKRALGEYVI